jgi:hypothetical protein
MNKRSKLWAILASGVLTLGIAGIALAEDLLEGQVGNTMGSYNQNCANFGPIGEGEIGVHFILSQPDASSSLLDAVFSTDSFTDLPDFDSNANALHWYAVITGDANTTILSAHSDANGNNLVVSHTCVGEESSSSSSSESSSTTSFSSSEESSTTSVSSSSESSSTTSFSSSEESSTTSVTTPPSDTIFDGGSGNQATGMWLLVAALGVLLGSLVVVAPARAKR